MSGDTGESNDFPAYSQYGPIEDALPLLDNLFDETIETKISPRFAGNPHIASVISKITATCTGEYVDCSQNTDKASMVTKLPITVSAYVSKKLIGDSDIPSQDINICRFEPLHGVQPNTSGKKSPKAGGDATYDSDGWLHIDPVCKSYVNKQKFIMYIFQYIVYDCIRIQS